MAFPRMRSRISLERSRAEGASIVLYLPKIQTAAEAAFWHDLLSALDCLTLIGVGPAHPKVAEALD